MVAYRDYRQRAGGSYVGKKGIPYSIRFRKSTYTYSFPPVVKDHRFDAALQLHSRVSNTSGAEMMSQYHAYI